MTDDHLRQLLEDFDDGAGPLHIVVEDCNVRDSDVEHCHISACTEGNEEARLLAAALYRRTPDERRHLMGWPDEYAVDEDGNHTWNDS